MNKKIIILITILVVGLIGVLGFFYYRAQFGAPAEEAPGPREFVPFAGSVRPIERPAQVDAPVPSDEVTAVLPVTKKPTKASKFKQITDYPIAGFIPINQGIRYVERATGNIYETALDQIQEVRISNTPIPKIEDAVFWNDAKSIVLRYLRNDQTIESFLGEVKEPVLGGDTTLELKGLFLNQNIVSVNPSPDKKKLFYLLETSGGVIGIIQEAGVDKRSQVFDSAFTEWLTEWVAPRAVSFQTKAAAGQIGYLYILDPETKDFQKILGGIAGLTAKTSPRGKKVLFADDTLALRILNLDTRAINTLSVETLPEKCVWAKDDETVYCAVPSSIVSNLYPDAWYQGLISFNDSFWKINTSTKKTDLLENPGSTLGQTIDAFNLSLDQDEKNLFFLNKKDSTLWSLDLIGK